MPVSCDVRGGEIIRDGGELFTGCSCEVGCIELADEMGPGLVTSSRRAARVPLEAGTLDNLGEGMGYAAVLCVSCASGEAITEGHWCRSGEGAHLAG